MSTSVLLSITHNLLEECRRAQIYHVTEGLVLKIIKGVLLAKKNDFDTEQVIEEEDINRLEQLCIENIERDGISLDTVRMQAYFEGDFSPKESFLNEYEKSRREAIAPLLREILGIHGRHREQLDVLYRKIASYIVLDGELGDPKHPDVMAECRLALQSVFPRSNLLSFISMSKLEKQRLVKDWTKVVSGIMLFNKECGNGGEHIVDLPQMLVTDLPSDLVSIETHLKQVSLEASQYALLQHEMSGEVDLLAAQYNARQEEYYLKILRNEIVDCAKHVEERMKWMRDMSEVMKSRILQHAAVPTVQVYPLFRKLADTWQVFQQASYWLKELNIISKEIRIFSKKRHETYPSTWISEHLGSREVTQDMLDEVKVEEDKMRLDSKKVVLTHLDQARLERATHNRDAFAFMGFCCWSLISLGEVRPGNLHLGVLLHKSLEYVFSCKEGIIDFANNPEHFIEKMHEMLEDHMETLTLFNLDREREGMARGKEQLVRVKCDAEAQTPLHFQESNLVKGYMWNEWDMRRQALQLANLRKKMTKSNQTNSSSLKNESSTQTLTNKSQTTQTKGDGWTNTPKPKRYIRGSPHKPIIVDLTLPITK